MREFNSDFLEVRAQKQFKTGQVQEVACPVSARAIHSPSKDRRAGLFCEISPYHFYSK
jgi:hypothetical protein